MIQYEAFNVGFSEGFQSTKIMTLLQYEAYFRDEIASKRLIGHTPNKVRFVMVDDNEISNAQNALDTTNFCMILYKYETDLTKNNSGKYFDKKICAFSIIKGLGKGKSSTSAKVLQSQAEIIAKKIWAKLLKDKRENTLGILADFDDNSFKIQSLTGVFDNAAGCTVEFEISPTINPHCGIYNAIDWE